MNTTKLTTFNEQLMKQQITNRNPAGGVPGAGPQGGRGRQAHAVAQQGPARRPPHEEPGPKT